MPKDANNNEYVNPTPLQAGVDKVDACGPQTEVTLYALTLTTANTQYQQILPSTCYRLKFRARTAVDVRWSFINALVATPTDPYKTLPSGTEFDSGPVRLTGHILYLASAGTGVVVEIEAHN
jgi:hypothetical protein